MRSNERFTHTPVSRSTVSGSSAASVSTKQNIVAKRGEIIPAPFACAASRTVPDSSFTSRQARFGARSVVRIESRSEEHTSELQSRQYLVCRLLLEKKKNT